MLESNTLADSIEKHIRESVDRSLKVFVQDTINQLALDPEWVSKIESIINQNFAQKFSESISMIDVNSLIAQHIDQGIERWQARLKKNFTTLGITDQGEKTELTVMPDTVVVENTLVSKDLDVVNNANIQQTLTVKDLILKGSINVDNHSWNELTQNIAGKTLDLIADAWKQELIDEVLDHAKTKGIEFDSVLIKGDPLIENGILNKSVTQSSIQELGILKSLTVSGEANFRDTMHVTNRRIGINTDRPDMALSVWDEEVTMSMGKIGDRHAFIGTSRLQDFSIGVNRTGYITINTDGLVTIKDLRIGRHRVAHSDQVPGYSGTKGDIVFNSDPREGAPFAWQCLGGFRWNPLRSA
jgi:hypothetical protein